MPRLAFTRSTAAALLMPACLLAAMLLPACSTGPKPPIEPPSAEAPAPDAPVATFPRISLSKERTTVGNVVREIGEEFGGGIAVMNGAENFELRSLSFASAPFERVVEEISSQTGLAVQQTPYYYFLYPEGYESLTRISLARDLDGPYADVTAAATFGAHLKLYTVLKWMSEALGLTLVADNAIAESRVGELAIGDVPLYATLEAILKTARVPAFRVDATEDYVFFGNPNALLRRQTLTNEAVLDQDMRAHLDKRVTLRIPYPPPDSATVLLESDAIILSEALPMLTAQLGLPVVAERDMREFPVNPVTMQDVPIGGALDLLIWQWPPPEFGYQFVRDRIVIRRLTPDEILEAVGAVPLE